MACIKSNAGLYAVSGGCTFKPGICCYIFGWSYKLKPVSIRFFGPILTLQDRKREEGDGRPLWVVSSVTFSEDGSGRSVCKELHDKEGCKLRPGSSFRWIYLHSLASLSWGTFSIHWRRLGLQISKGLWALILPNLKTLDVAKNSTAITLGAVSSYLR